MALVTVAVAIQRPSAADDGATPPLAAGEAGSVSYYKDVLPIFQAHCQGCHQPARANGAT
ncbi:MAG: hypothetical protein R3B90_22130 [Planctomycetaceae bacterium]